MVIHEQGQMKVIGILPPGTFCLRSPKYDVTAVIQLFDSMLVQLEVNCERFGRRGDMDKNANAQEPSHGETELYRLSWF
jgi:hypothetical protein